MLYRSLTVAASLILAACSASNAEGPDGPAPPDDSPTGCAGYEQTGPWAVGVATIDMAGTPVEVWYPADAAATATMTRATYDMREWLPEGERNKIPAAESPLFEMPAYRDAPATDAGAPFPVVLFSHGMGGYRMQSSMITAHLASWGFVVAAPEHPERGLAILVEKGAPAGDDSPQALRDTRTLLQSENTRAGALLEGRLDMSKIGLAGHSAGGGAVLSVASEDWVSAWVTHASGGFGSGGGPEIPSLMMVGTNDQIASADNVERAFDRQAADKQFVSIAGMGHLGFTDICAIAPDEGGVLQVAIDHGIEVPEILQVLGNDGCTENDMAPDVGWPIVNHYTTAQLRFALGIDAEPVGLDDESAGCFGDNIATYKHD